MENTNETVLVSSHISVEVRDRFAAVAHQHDRSLAAELRHMIHEAIDTLQATSEQR